VDLEDAAAQALTKVKALEAEIEEGQNVLTEAEDKITEMRKQLDADWTRVTEDAEKLLQQVAEERSELAKESGEAIESLGRLKAKVDSVHQGVRQELTEAQADVAALEERVTALEPEVGSLFDAAEQAIQGAKSQVEDADVQVASAVGDAGVAAARAGSHLEGFEQVLEPRLKHLATYLDEVCADAVEQTVQGWTESLRDAVMHAVAEGVEAVSLNTEQALDEALQECEERHREALEEVGQLSVRLEAVLDRLSQSVLSGTAEMAQLTDAGAQSLRETSTGTEQLLAALLKVRGLLASFTFVKM
jgi:DNA repair exonuclease SbcCD ATPase subunit